MLSDAILKRERDRKRWVCKAQHFSVSGTKNRILNTINFAHLDQCAAFKGNSSPKLKAKEKKGAKLSSPFNLNIPTHARRKVLLNARPSYAGVSAADHILA